MYSSNGVATLLFDSCFCVTEHIGCKQLYMHEGMLLLTPANLRHTAFFTEIAKHLQE